AVTADPLYIGTKAPGGTQGNHFNGAIDDVRLYNYGLSAADVATLASTTAPPAAPSSEIATATSASTITVKWTDNALGQAGFRLERKTGAAGTYAVIATLPAGTTLFNDSGLAATTDYYYRVRAFNAFDASPYAPEAHAMTQGTVIHSLVGEWNFDTPATAGDVSGHG